MLQSSASTGVERSELDAAGLHRTDLSLVLRKLSSISNGPAQMRESSFDLVLNIDFPLLVIRIAFQRMKA